MTPADEADLTQRAIIAAAYWLDCSAHERTEEDGIILARYARMKLAERVSADKIAMILSEELGVTDVGFVAVKLAEMIERGEMKPL
jgi:hypothetical protein